MSSKSSPWTTGRDALELLTTAETATSRRVAGTAFHPRPDRDVVTCRSISAGAVRLRSHTIKMRYVNRREAKVQLWKENRTNDVNSDAHGDVADDAAEAAKGTGVQEYQVGAEEADVADVSNRESKSLKRRGKQFFDVRKALEMPMQDTGTARERKLVRRSVLEAELAVANSTSREREFSDRVLWEQGTSKAKENLNNLDTKTLGREVISSCA